MTHKEAFALMLYRCETCGFEERLWNSRDGVTPFGVDCRRCGNSAYHVEWYRDQVLPDYDPPPGDRYFRDVMPEEARAFMRRRLESGRGTPDEIPEEEWPEFIARATAPETMVMPGGRPVLVVRGTDADALPLKREGV